MALFPKQALMAHWVPPSLGKGVTKPKKLLCKNGRVRRVNVSPSTFSRSFMAYSPARPFPVKWGQMLPSSRDSIHGSPPSPLLSEQMRLTLSKVEKTTWRESMVQIVDLDERVEEGLDGVALGILGRLESVVGPITISSGHVGGRHEEDGGGLRFRQHLLEGPDVSQIDLEEGDVEDVLGVARIGRVDVARGPVQWAVSVLL